MHQPFNEKEVKAIALIFISTDCPIANAFQPSLRQLQKAYADRGVACFMVHCSANVTSEDVRKHATDYEITMPIVIDSSQELGRLTGAKVTPEAIVIDRSEAVRYRGLINDLYAGYGKKRRVASKHYLRDAIDSVIAGKEVFTKVTKPVGCFIYFEDTEAKASP